MHVTLPRELGCECDDVPVHWRIQHVDSAARSRPDLRRTLGRRRNRRALCERWLRGVYRWVPESPPSSRDRDYNCSRWGRYLQRTYGALWRTELSASEQLRVRGDGRRRVSDRYQQYYSLCRRRRGGRERRDDCGWDSDVGRVDTDICGRRSWRCRCRMHPDGFRVRRLPGQCDRARCARLRLSLTLFWQPGDRSVRFTGDHRNRLGIQ